MNNNTSIVSDLREKRSKVWDEAKNFLDSKQSKDGHISEEDNKTYEKMEQEVVNLGKEISRLERQASIEFELSRPVNSPILSKPSIEKQKEKTGRASNEYKDAFWQAMRNKHNFEVRNALQEGTDSEGGYLVPDEFEKTLVEALGEENISRQQLSRLQKGRKKHIHAAASQRNSDKYQKDTSLDG